MKRLIPLVLICALLLPALATVAASAQTPPPVATATAFDKTKFVFDVGTAAFAIHHFIYLPYKGGRLHGFFAYAKAALAAAFAINRLNAAYRIANSGDSKLLKAIVSPFNALLGALGKVKSKITHGDTSAISTANSTLGSLSTAAAGAGAPFSDVTNSLH